MRPRNVKSESRDHGEVLTAISDGLVALLKEFYGRSPTRAKSSLQDDLEVCVQRGGFSRVVLQDATGRRVIGSMSGNGQDPDMMCEVFILAPSDLVDEHEPSLS